MSKIKIRLVDKIPLPHVILNMISEYIIIEDIDDFYAIRLLDPTDKILANNLKQQTLCNPDIKDIQLCLNMPDSNDMYINNKMEALLKVNMYHACLKLFDYFVDSNDSPVFLPNTISNLTDQAIRHHDFDNARQIHLSTLEPINGLGIVYWITKGDERQRQFVLDNIEQWCYHNSTYIELLQKCYELKMYDICILAIHILQENKEFTVSTMYQALIPGEEKHFVWSFNDHVRGYFMDEVLDLIRDNRDFLIKSREVLAKHNVNQDLIDQFLPPP